VFYQERRAIPYSVTIARGMGSFQSHRHPDIELIMCLDGEFIATADEVQYPVSAGDIFFASSMMPHGIISTGCMKSSLLINIGPVFSTQLFSQIERLRTDAPVISHDDDREEVQVFRHVLHEIIEERKNTRKVSEYMIIGSLYKVGACLIEIFGNENSEITSNIEYSRTYYAIEKAVETVHSRYNEQITVDEIAEATGYSKSSFCAIFKNSIGTSFHSYLNEFRIKTSCYLLSNTDIPISEVSDTVGFTDVKTFYRAFSRVMDTTPGIYRDSAHKG